MNYDDEPYEDLPSEYRDLMIRLDACVEQRVRLGVRMAEVKQILAEFYRAPLTLASVQPILDLAVELNPELKPQKSVPVNR